jgi:hypothetical protein
MGPSAFLIGDELDSSHYLFSPQGMLPARRTAPQRSGQGSFLHVSLKTKL